MYACIRTNPEKASYSRSATKNEWTNTFSKTIIAHDTTKRWEIHYYEKVPQTFFDCVDLFQHLLTVRNVEACSKMTKKNGGGGYESKQNEVKSRWNQWSPVKTGQIKWKKVGLSKISEARRNASEIKENQMKTRK